MFAKDTKSDELNNYQIQESNWTKFEFNSIEGNSWYKSTDSSIRLPV